MVVGDPCPRFGDDKAKPVVVTPQMVVTSKAVVTPKARKADRHKGSRAEYMRSYRARKAAK